MPSGDTETTISSHPKRKKYQSIWLDELPIDVCTRIVSFLLLQHFNLETGIPLLPDALSLGVISPIQQIAVASSRSNILSIEQVNDATHTTVLIRLWRDILQTIHEVRLPIDVANNDDVRSLLSLPTIYKAVIPSYPYLLCALQAGRSLRFLELRTTMYCPEAGENGLPLGLSEVLLSCPIEKLFLTCSGCYKYPRVSCSSLGMLQPMQRCEGRKCTTLRSLHLKCSSERMEELMTTSSFFPNLEEFRVEHWIAVDHFFLEAALQPNMSEEIYEHLRRIKKVEMIHCGSVDNFIPHLGSNLRGLSSITPVRSTEVVTFKTCPDLQSLDIVLEEGAEVCFPQNLCHLTSISLTWNPKHRPSLHEHYYTPASEPLSGLIQRNKQIEVLRLKNAKMTSSLLSELLSTSSKLRILSVPIFHQGEPPTHRFSRLVKLIIRYNGCLERLEICSSSFRIANKLPVLLHHESGICDPSICEFCDLLRRIDSASGVLKRRLVRFCDDGMQRLKYNLEPWR